MPAKAYLTQIETSLIEDAAPCLRDKLLIRLLRRLGCRVGEVLSIEEKNIDFSLRQIKIEHEKLRIKRSCPHCGVRLSKSHAFCSKCGKSVEEAVAKENKVRHLRNIPVDQDTLDLIHEYINKVGITTFHGKRLLFRRTRQWAWWVVVKCAEKAGFFELENTVNERKHHVSPHKFRDAFATNIVKKRPTIDDARLLQELLGHQNINTTLKYRKVAGTELQKFYDGVIAEDQ